ncbi:MAG TPA: hypothetical protein H9867_03370, partial [Candidatus Corynebacterium gallistercoris]|nr:hypothetical protein [Candidatus Corynebacterium gallistercoris]
MLTITSAHAECYSTPVRVPIGAGLAVEVPDGEGLISARWQAGADAVRQVLAELEARYGTSLQYRRVAPDCVEVRVADAALPVITLLGHPSLARQLNDSLQLLFGGAAAIYLRDGALRATPASSAGERAGWVGPLGLDTGFC